MIIMFINFICTFSFTLTPSLTAITTQITSVNNDFLYIKFPNSLLFNDDCNEYLMWKWKIFDKFLIEDWKYVKIKI